jgi:hypothetical protein
MKTHRVRNTVLAVVGSIVMLFVVLAFIGSTMEPPASAPKPKITTVTVTAAPVTTTVTAPAPAPSTVTATATVTAPPVVKTVTAAPVVKKEEVRVTSVPRSCTAALERAEEVFALAAKVMDGTATTEDVERIEKVSKYYLTEAATCRSEESQ